METNVLVVAADAARREKLGELLEGAGYQVLGCPGPDSDGHCIGLSRDSCALTAAADVALLDLSSVREVGPLQAHYRWHGLEVVGTSDREPIAWVLEDLADAVTPTG